LAYSPIVVIANKDDTVNNPKELVDVLLKDRVTVADSGGAGRLGLESILVNMDIRKKNPQVIRIEHKGPAESVTDVMGGHVRFATVPLAVAYQHHKAGKLKIVALTTKDKTPGFPVEGFSAINQNIDVGLVWGIAMPQGTSKEAQEYWVNAFNNAKKDPRVIENFEVNMISFENKYNTPSKFTQYVNEQYKNNSKVVDYIVNSTK
jgi:tripartite-type tricarboxylate transporter receptor subunit TctC